MKKIIKILVAILLAIVLVVVIYLAYAFIAYYRIDDNVSIETIGTYTDETAGTNTQYRIASANLGFGAYSDDYSFFMDGGTESWAFSKESVIDNITGSMNTIAGLNADFIVLQEVDIDGTRSYHVDQSKIAVDQLRNQYGSDFNYTFAQNYDSPFLFYPITQPHGANKAGLITTTKYRITDSIRRSLPIEEGFTKMIDLDRCYCKNYIDLDNGKQLVLINMHLSAYTTDPSTAENQIIMLTNDIDSEYQKGNYVIAGGDMNKDLLGDSSAIFKKGSLEANWAAPFPVDLLKEHQSLVAPFDESNPIPSCRNADMPYSEDDFVLTVDGFIVTDNVDVIYANVCENGFKYSDHQPVYMDFILK